MKKIIVSIIVIGLLLGTVPLSIGKTKEDISGIVSRNLEGADASLIMEGEVSFKLSGQYENITTSPEYWALFIAGHGNGEWWSELEDENRFFYSLKRVKSLLCGAGWKESHIKILDPESRPNDVFDAFDWLRQHADSNDIILLYLYGHGGTIGFGIDGGGLSYERLGQELNQTEYSCALVIISACYSGAAIPYLRQDNRTIITACKADEGTNGFRFLLDNSLSKAGDCEGNKDGSVTDEEIYSYVEKYDYEHFINPQMQDNYSGEIVVTRYNYAEEGFLDQYQLADSLGSIFNNVQLARQSFKPTNSTLSQVMLKLYGNGKIATVKIYNETGICIAGAIKKTQTFVEKPPGRSYWETFDFSDAPVVPGQTYYIACSSDYGSSNIYWCGYHDDAYPDGEATVSYDGGETWEPAQFIDDHVFITSGFEYSIPNRPPYVPGMPSGITQGNVGEVYEYSSYGIDPDGDQVFIMFDWGDGTYSGWVGPNESGEKIHMNHTWLFSDRFEVRTRTRNSGRNISEWSDALFVHINPPDPPSITGPTSGTAGEGYDYTFVSIDPDGDDVYYWINWGEWGWNAPTVEWIGPYESGEEVTVSHAWSKESNPDEPYVIKAKAKDIHGAEGSWATLEVTMPVNQPSSQQSSSPSIPQGNPQSNPSGQTQYPSTQGSPTNS